MNIKLIEGYGKFVQPMTYSRAILFVPINGYERGDIEVHVNLVDYAKYELNVVTKGAAEFNLNQLLRASKFADDDAIKFIERDIAFTRKPWGYTVAVFSIEPKGKLSVKTDVIKETLLIEVVEEIEETNYTIQI